jgi:hypothetical protein
VRSLQRARVGFTYRKSNEVGQLASSAAEDSVHPIAIAPDAAR